MFKKNRPSVETARFPERKTAPSTMARFPIEKIAKNEIGQMKVGDSGYTVPWAMGIRRNGQCFLNSGYTIYPDTGGTVQMRVERTPRGYAVTAPEGYEYKHDDYWGDLPVAQLEFGGSW